MKEQSTHQSSERIHGLDALRGVLMLLGVVLHTALVYMPGSGGPFFRDPNASTSAAPIIIDGIHLFRMPTFFVISGFFGALLWQKRGVLPMLKNRLARLALPMTLFVILLWPPVVFAFSFGHGLVNDAVAPLSSSAAHSAANLLPDNTMHLWFLYYLIWISVMVAAIVLVFKRLDWSWPWLLAKTREVAESPWRSLVVFGLLNGLWWLIFGWNTLPTSSAWVPAPTILLYYLLCYSVGWTLFVSKIRLAKLKDRAWTLLAIGVGCVALRTLTSSHIAQIERGAGAASLLAVAPWLMLRAVIASAALVAFARGFTGIFLHYASTGSKGWRYLSDSSYWVYLLHLPLAALVPALLVEWQAPALLKWTVAALVTGAICIATYDLAVRATIVGRLLNGRTFPRQSLAFSGILSVLLIGAIAHATTHVPPPLERTPPWREGKTPEQLLPAGQLIFPLSPKPSTSGGVSLNRCVGSKRHAICPSAGNFDAATAGCQRLGGQLAVFESEEENRRVSSLVWKLSRRPFWINLRDTESEGDWRWANGEELRYTSWNRGEPNNAGGHENCAATNWNKEAGWNDANCDHTFGFVCEFDRELKATP